MREELQKVRDWAQAKITTGQEPPWAWFQYMKLVENCDAILAGMDATTTASLWQSPAPQGEHLRLVGSTCPPDTAPRRHVGLPVQMPT